MSKQFRIIENFYRDPVAVRNFAKSIEYVPKGTYSQNFAGIESLHSLYTETVIEKLMDAAGEPIEVDPSVNAFGRFRLAFGADTRRTQVHSDNTDWTAVVYLTEERFCRGGTFFYRHKETGLESPPNEEWLSSMGISRKKFDEEIILRDTLDPEKWEVTAHCPMKFNRCVLLKGSQFFHGSDQLFGSTFDDGRLTQNFFFNIRETKP